VPMARRTRRVLTAPTAESRVDLEGDLGHERGDDRAADREARSRRALQVDPADLCDVCADAHCRRAAVEEARLGRDIETLDHNVNDGTRPNATRAGIRDVSDANLTDARARSRPAQRVPAVTPSNAECRHP
jgi:hypothetical protein